MYPHHDTRPAAACTTRRPAALQVLPGAGLPLVPGPPAGAGPHPKGVLLCADQDRTDQAWLWPGAHVCLPSCLLTSMCCCSCPCQPAPPSCQPHIQVVAIVTQEVGRVYQEQAPPGNLPKVRALQQQPATAPSARTHCACDVLTCLVTVRCAGVPVSCAGPLHVNRRCCRCAPSTRCTSTSRVSTPWKPRQVMCARQSSTGARLC